MAVHPLQSRNHQPVRDRWDPERAASDLDDARAPSQGAGDRNLFSGLTETPHVNLNRLGQSGNNKVPFVGQAISPAPRGKLGFETPLHEADYVARVCVGVEIQVAAKIGPVIQRLDYRNIKSFGFEGVANCPQKRECVLDADALARDCRGSPFGVICVAPFTRYLAEALQPAHDYVISTGERQ